MGVERKLDAIFSRAKRLMLAEITALGNEHRRRIEDKFVREQVAFANWNLRRVYLTAENDVLRTRLRNLEQHNVLLATQNFNLKRTLFSNGPERSPGAMSAASYPSPSSASATAGSMTYNDDDDDPTANANSPKAVKVEAQSVQPATSAIADAIDDWPPSPHAENVQNDGVPAAPATVSQNILPIAYRTRSSRKLLSARKTCKCEGHPAAPQLTPQRSASHRIVSRRHSRIHNANRPLFRCDVPGCDRAYLDKSSLNKHRRTLHSM